MISYFQFLHILCLSRLFGTPFVDITLEFLAKQHLNWLLILCPRLHTEIDLLLSCLGFLAWISKLISQCTRRVSLQHTIADLKLQTRYISANCSVTIRPGLRRTMISGYARWMHIHSGESSCQDNLRSNSRYRTRTVQNPFISVRRCNRLSNCSHRRVHLSVSAVSNTPADRNHVQCLKLFSFLHTDSDQTYIFTLFSTCLPLQIEHYQKDR